MRYGRAEPGAGREDETTVRRVRVASYAVAGGHVEEQQVNAVRDGVLLDDLAEGQFAVNRATAPQAGDAHSLFRVREDFQVNEFRLEAEERGTRQEVAAAEAVVERRVERPRLKTDALEGQVGVQGGLRDSER
jgi:hypothetical protein